MSGRSRAAAVHSPQWANHRARPGRLGTKAWYQGGPGARSIRPALWRLPAQTKRQQVGRHAQKQAGTPNGSSKVTCAETTDVCQNADS